jgi:hypothetical protein
MYIDITPTMSVLKLETGSLWQIPLKLLANDVLLVQIDSGGLLASAKRIIAIFVSRL